MKNKFCLIGALITLTAFAPSSQAGFLDALGLGKSSTNSSTATSAALGALSNDQLVGGLKEALGNGLQHAVAQLGQDGGYLNNLNVKIPMPEKLHAVEKTLRTLGQGKLRMNLSPLSTAPPNGPFRKPPPSLATRSGR